MEQGEGFVSVQKVGLTWVGFASGNNEFFGTRGI